MKFWDFLKKVIKKLILIAIFIYSIFALVLGGIDFLEYWVGFEHDLWNCQETCSREIP